MEMERDKFKEFDFKEFLMVLFVIWHSGRKTEMFRVRFLSCI